MKKIIYRLSLVLITLFVGCTDEVEFSSNTEALASFSIVSPTTSANYVLNSGTPDKTIDFDWLIAKPGVIKKATYTVHFFKIDTEVPFKSFISNNEGKTNKLTASFSNLDTALTSAGFTAAEKATVQWQVEATNGDVIVKTAKTNISITRFAANGIASFDLLTPTNNKLIKADIYGTPNEEIEFTWQTATTTSGVGTIEYTLLFDELDGDFSSPLKSFPAASTTSFKMTHKEIGENFTTNPNVKWTVQAKVSGENILLNASEQFINWNVFVLNEFYLIGSHNAWSNTTATPFVDKGNGVFELQIELAANAEFKFLPQLGSSEGDWGESKTLPGTLEKNDEKNIKIVNAGKYVIKVDFTTLSFTVTEFKAPDNLFMVGSHNGWNNADLTQQFNNDGNGVFSKVQMFDAGAVFKFLPTSGSWDGDWGESKTTPGDLVQDDEQNIKITDAGTYVVIVDFNTSKIKTLPINNLFAVGSHNGWNNADVSQQFNSSGNGVFTKVLTFDAGAEFKLLPVSGSWDGDWAENKATVGGLVQDDEQNIKIVTAGTYVITIDFNTLTFHLKELPDSLFLVGSPNGWDNATAPAFTKISEGIFELSLALTTTDEFKLLPQQGSWDNDWAESKIYAGMLTRDEEQNFKSPGNGTFKITVDFNNGTVNIL